MLKQTKARHGPDQIETLAYMNNVATVYEDAGKYDQAIPLYEETLKLSKAKCGMDDPQTLTIMNNLAGAYRQTKKLNLAVSLYEETLKLRKTRLGLDHPDTLRCMNNLAGTYWQADQLDKSIPLFEETLKRQIAMLGRDHPSTLLTIANLGVNLKDAGRFPEALPLLEEAYRVSQKYPKFRGFCNSLFECYIQTGQSAPATALVKDVVVDARTALPKESPQLADALATLGSSLLQVKVSTEAEPLLRECLDIREKTQPDSRTTFNTKSMLGGAMLGQKKYADAEPLLLAGYEGMKQRKKSIPPQGNTRLPEALDRLIQLYTETNKPDDVKKWQAEKDKMPKPE